MMTKEVKTVRKCCLYASDFHLEMILLPYIKERINKSKFIIITENDLSDTIKTLLDRVNIDKSDKKKILDINWQESNKVDMDFIKNVNSNQNDVTIIIKGNKDYIQTINNNLEPFVKDYINIIDCFDINDINLDINYVKNNYKEFLNTSKI